MRSAYCGAPVTALLVMTYLCGIGRAVPDNITLLYLPPYSPELNPKENLWDEIREKIFKNYALKSMDEVRAKLRQAVLYIERNPNLVRSITSFPYIANSL
jgi:transposase